MNKRGQFYIIIAVVLSLAIFSITSQNNKIEDIKSFYDFSELSENYLEEAQKVVDYSIYNGEDINENLPQFTQNFLEYARKTNPSIGLIYIYSNETNLTLKSYLNETSEINSTNLSMTVFGSDAKTINEVSIKIAGKTFIHQVPLKIKNYGEDLSEAQFSTPNWLSLNIAGIFHNFDLSDKGPLLNVIIRADNGDLVEIYSTGSNTDFDFTGKRHNFGSHNLGGKGHNHGGKRWKRQSHH